MVRSEAVGEGFVIYGSGREGGLDIHTGLAWSWSAQFPSVQYDVGSR